MPSERQAGDCRCAKDLRVIGENERLKAANERLKAENARLREQLGKVRRTALEQPFGLSAPSSKRLVKPNAPEPESEECPHCHGELVEAPFGADEARDVVVGRPVRAYVRRYTPRVRYCPHGTKPVRTRVPGVMDGCRYAGYAFIELRAFCLEHPRRDALKAADDNPKAYRREAVAAGRELYGIVMRPARHPDVQKLRDVFRDARLQCWQWMVDVQIPVENNRSEREVRPLTGPARCPWMTLPRRSDDERRLGTGGADIRTIARRGLHAPGDAPVRLARPGRKQRRAALFTPRMACRWTPANCRPTEGSCRGVRTHSSPRPQADRF